MYRIRLLLMLLLGGATAGLAQNPTVSLNQSYCLSGDTIQVTAYLLNPTSFVYSTYEVNWEYQISPSSYTTVLNGPFMPGDTVVVTHTYNLASLYNAFCPTTNTKLISLRSTQNNGTIVSNLSPAIFRSPPRARINLTDTVVCINELFNINNGCAPNADNPVTYVWSYGDGSPSDTSHSTNHLYTTPGVYQITLYAFSASNPSCGNAVSTRNVRVISEPVADIDVLSSTTSGTGSQADPYIICIGSGSSGVVALTGLPSLNEQGYFWQSSGGGSWVPLPPPGGNPIFTPSPSYNFTNTGNYSIRLIVNNECNRPDTAFVFFEVYNQASLSLNPQPDACAPVSYTPSPFLAGAVYSINGAVTTTFPVLLGSGNYAISAVLSGPCGSFNLTDTFSINVLSPPVITTVGPVSVCVGDPDILLVASPSGGTWLSQHLVQTGGQNYFSPVQAGNFLAIYQISQGSCVLSDTLSIGVVASPTVNLLPQPDFCNTLNYSPQPFLANYTYNLNGVSQSNFPVALGPGIYIIEATITSNCGTATRRDTFQIFTTPAAQISSPTQDTLLCLGGAAISLASSSSSGIFSGTHVSGAVGSFTFNPVQVGSFPVLLTVQNALCTSYDTINIQVQDTSVSIQNIQACGNDTLVNLPSLGGGTWQCPTCPSCIMGNLFDIRILPPGSQDTVELLYSETNASGCSGSARSNLIVIRPVAAFSASSTPCYNVPMSIDFSSATGSSFNWTLNGQLQGSPPFGNIQPGLNTVILTANLLGCTDTLSQTINIIGPPSSPAFILDRNEGCSPLMLSFSPVSPAQPGELYSLDFGNGQTSTSYGSQSTTYVGSGTDVEIFTITYSVQNPCSTFTTTDTLQLNPFPVAEIGIDSSNWGCNPYTTILSNRSVGNPDTSYWSIDGQYIAGYLPFINYTFQSYPYLPRTYTVILYVLNECGMDSDTMYVTVYPELFAFYNAPKYILCPGETVTLTDASTSIPLYWRWNSSDGQVKFGPNPSFTFNTPNDTVTVTLTIGTQCDTSTITHTFYILAASPANFGVPNYFCQDERVTLNNLSPNNLVSYEWEFPGNVTSSDYNPSFVFQNPGQQLVTLTVSNLYGCTSTLSKYIEIRPKVILDFGVSNQLLCVDDSVQLLNNSQYANRFIWYFSNDILSTEEAPTYVFENHGFYDISLIGSFNGSCGDTLTKVEYIEVQQCEPSIPNAFTPNGDGLNDYFKILSDDIFFTKILHLAIYDRWGKLLYVVEDVYPNEKLWDGTFERVPVDPGVYVGYATVKLPDGDVRFYKFNITLLR
jgi:gliding motility-associated-like protein